MPCSLLEGGELNIVDFKSILVFGISIAFQSEIFSLFLVHEWPYQPKVVNTAQV